MYKLLEKQSTIEGFKVYEKEVFINQKNNLFESKTKILENVEGYSFWKLGDYGIFFHDLDGELKFLDKNGKINGLEDNVFGQIYFNNKVLSSINLRRNDGQWHWDLGVLDLKSLVYDNLPDTQNIDPIEYHNEGILGKKDKNFILYYSLKKQKILWQININSYNLNVKKYLGIWKSKLFFACSDNTILGLSLENGKVLNTINRLERFGANSDSQNLIPDPTNFKLDNNTGKLIGIYHTFYIEIDLETEETYFEDIRQELQNNEIKSFRPVANNPFTKDHFFLTAFANNKEKPDVLTDAIVVLNRHTRKVDWKYIFSENGLGTNTPQINEKNLYQLDLNGNLHIFEKIDPSL